MENGKREVEVKGQRSKVKVRNSIIKSVAELIAPMFVPKEIILNLC